jgi:hypothetical protein
MEKAFVALAAVGTAVVLLVLARRVGHEMREHSKQMKAHCKQMAAHCKEMMASTNGCSEVPSEREVEGTSGKQLAGAPTA